MNRAHREEVVLTQRNNMLANERFPWRRRSDPIGRKIACLVFTMKALIPVLATAIVILFFAPRAEALETLTAQDVVSWAQYGMGYSYWWGNGRWRTDKASPGSCSGSCPKCKHSGSYGADCSGFVAKVWRVPSSTPLTYVSPTLTKQVPCGCRTRRTSRNTSTKRRMYSPGLASRPICLSIRTAPQWQCVRNG